MKVTKGLGVIISLAVTPFKRKTRSISSASPGSIVPSFMPTSVRREISSSDVVNGETPLVNGLAINSMTQIIGDKIKVNQRKGTAAIGNIIWLQRSPAFLGIISEKIIVRKVRIPEKIPIPLLENCSEA